jgi:hypothetical protein
MAVVSRRYSRASFIHTGTSISEPRRKRSEKNWHDDESGLTTAQP